MDWSELMGPDEDALDSDPIAEDDSLSLGDTIDQYVVLKNEIDALNKQITDKKEQLDRYSQLIISRMNDAGVDQTATASARVVKKTELQGNVKDMEALVRFCADNGRTDMIQRRISAPAFREYFEQNGMYPDGTDGYYQEKVTVTRKKK